MSTSRTRAMVLLFVAFAAGIVVGAAGLTTAFRAGKADFIWRGMGGGGRGMMGGGGPSGGMGAWVAKELDVQAEKRDSIIAIYKRGSSAVDSIVHGNIRAPMDSLWESIRPAVEARRLQTRADVRALLTPQQQVRYDSMTQASDANRKKMRDQSRGGPRGPR